MEFFDKKLKEILDRAYALVTSGYCQENDWRFQMVETIHSTKSMFASLPDAELKELITEIWNHPYETATERHTIAEWAAKFDAETPYQKEVRNHMDNLFKTITEYQKSSFFLNMLRFCSSFKELAPYNALMVKTQMPSARYVLNLKQWEQMYGRKLRRNARPLVILRKYGPIDYVYEIGDTEPDPNANNLFAHSDEDILQQLANPYGVTGNIDPQLYRNLVKALSYYGICLDKFRVGSSFGAQIIKTDCRVQVKDIHTKGYFVINVNERADMNTSFASICHELGHLFCHHLTQPDTGSEWWKWRRLSWEEKEFEAEIVSYIICKRYGVENRSWTYLTNVLGKTGEIPKNVSVHYIFRAANEVERMLDENLEPRYCFLYNHDKDFKREYNRLYPSSIKEEEEEEE